MADIQDLVSRVRKSRLGQAVSNIASSLDRDKEREGFQLISPQQRQSINNAQKSFRYGLSGQSQGRRGLSAPTQSGGTSYNIFNQVKPTIFDPISNYRPVQGQPSIGEAVSSTSQNVVEDFGKALSGKNTIFGKTPVLSNLSEVSSRTGQTIASGVQDIGRGTYNVFDTGKSGLERVGSGGSQIIRGIGKVAAPATQVFQLANIGAELGPNQSQRFSSGVLQGMTGQQNLQGLPDSRQTLNLPFLGAVDPYEQVGSMIGFTQNPVNREFFKLTETLIPSKGNAVNWLLSTSARGSLEDVILNLDEIISSEDRTQALLNNMGQGAISELIGQGIIKSTGKGFEIVSNSEGGRQLKQTLNNALEGLSDVKRRWNTPVKTLEQDPRTGEFITKPMWQVVLQNQRGGVGATNDLLEGRVGTDDVVDPRTGNIVSGQTIEPQKIKTQQVIKSQDPEIAVQKANSSTPQKKRKFIQTVIKSKEATPKMKEAVAKIDPQKYTVQPNVQSIAFADEYINKNGLDSAKEFVVNSKKPDQDTIATGLELMRQYQAQGNYDQALEVLEALDNQGREAGRLIQSLSMWNRLSPEGMLRFAQKEFNKANERFTKLGRVELDEELVRNITTRMNAIGRMADGPEKTQATKDVLNLISEKIPWSVSELLDAYRYQNMLSGPNTQFRNIYGNAFQGAILRPSTIPFEVVNDYIGATLRGQERTRYFNEVPIYLRKFWGSMPEATEAFLQSMKGQDIDVKRLDLDQQRRQNLPQALTVVPRFMEGMDRFFSTMIRNAETARLMSNGINEKQALEEANKIAENLLFRSQLDPSNKTGQGQLLSGIDKAVSWIQKSPVPGMRWFVPFVSTPTNVLKQLIEYSPGVGLANLPGNDKKGQLLAKQALASVVALGGAQLAMSGKATWAAPTDPKEKELFYATGRKPYSVRIGDTWIPLSYLGPLAGAVALPAAINYWQNESKTSLTDSQLKKLGKIAGAQMEFISQQSFLSNVGTMIDIMRGDIDSSVEGTLGFTAGQLIPLSGLVRYINKAVDPVYRKARGFTESIAKDLPGFSKELEAYTTPDGQISTRETRNLFLPFDVGTARDEYELPLRERQEYNKQRNSLNFAKKQLEAGRLPTGETLKTGSGLTTSQTRDFIREKIKLGFDVPPEELETAYLKTALDMPSSNRYERGQKESKLFSTLGNIENNENLSTSQKDILKDRIAEEVGLTREDLDVYQVAKQTNNEKTLYLLDQRDAQSNDEFLRTLIRGRKPINGKVLTSDGVLDNLVQDGIIPEQLAKDLKKIDLDEKGQLKTRKTSGSGKKIKTAQFNYSALSSLKPFGSSASVAVPKINVSNLTFGG